MKIHLKFKFVLYVCSLFLCLLSFGTLAVANQRQLFKYDNDDFSILLPKGTRIEKSPNTNKENSYWNFFYIPVATSKNNNQKNIVLEIKVPAKDFHYSSATEDAKRKFLAHGVTLYWYRN